MAQIRAVLDKGETTSPQDPVTASTSASSGLAPGSVITVRDEDWLITGVDVVYERATPQDIEPTKPVHRIAVQGLSELVRDTSAVFLDSIDEVEVRDPREAPLVNDTSPGYRDSKLWLESTLRKTDLPVDETRLSLSAGMLIDPKVYQQTPVHQVLNPENLRPRLLIADAVGLGKTIEIGLILAELIRRGRGDRILIVTPKHVLEQMQHEMWTKFAIPFVRLDSEGIRKIRQKLPATRNPFTYFKRAIISIDTLKSDRYLAHLRNHQWDAVVIDESHNVTNTGTLNNRLADTLAKNSDALILASATPHNGDPKAFAELIRLLEPTAVNPDGTVDQEAVKKLYVRRHRNSPEVAREVGDEWAERLPPRFLTVPASEAENAVAQELDSVWLHPAGSSPYSGATALFPWTLAKAFLSSPEALLESIDNRLRTLRAAETATVVASPTSVSGSASPTPTGEAAALNRLRALTEDCVESVENNRARKRPQAGKYGALLDYLTRIGVAANSDRRAVVFAERVATLHTLKADLTIDLKLKSDQVEVLHGGLSDVEQQKIVEDFKTGKSRIRVLVTGDVASEGVNLHQQCHHLVHYDIPWSLIRIEQRNGRIDRYGQRENPQITALILEPEAESFAGDIRVLQKLIEKENEAHKVFGEAAALMGEFNADAEEKTIRTALARGIGQQSEQEFDDLVPAPDSAHAFRDTWMTDLLSGAIPPPGTEATQGPTAPALPPKPAAKPTAHLENADGLTMFDQPVDYLRDALRSIYHDQQDAPPSKEDSRGGGVAWREHRNMALVELRPPLDLTRRFEDLPQSYIKERKVKEKLQLATTKDRGRDLITRARDDRESTTLWPEAHYLGPLHPILDWTADRILAAVPERGGIYAVRADVATPTVAVHAILTNRRGQTVSSIYRSITFLDPNDPSTALTTPYSTVHELVRSLKLTESRPNTGDIDLAGFQALVPAAVDQVNVDVQSVFEAARSATDERVHRWKKRSATWKQTAAAQVQTAAVKRRTHFVDSEQALIDAMAPANTFVRPLLLAVPRDTPIAHTAEGITTP